MGSMVSQIRCPFEKYKEDKSRGCGGYLYCKLNPKLKSFDDGCNSRDALNCILYMKSDTLSKVNHESIIKVSDKK